MVKLLQDVASAARILCLVAHNAGQSVAEMYRPFKVDLFRHVAWASRYSMIFHVYHAKYVSWADELRPLSL